jgi:hypothetical protein
MKEPLGQMRERELKEKTTEFFEPVSKLGRTVSRTVVKRTSQKLKINEIAGREMRILFQILMRVVMEDR